MALHALRVARRLITEGSPKTHYVLECPGRPEAMQRKPLHEPGTQTAWLTSVQYLILIGIGLLALIAILAWQWYTDRGWYEIEALRRARTQRERRAQTEAGEPRPR
jgi:hypothetical protein